MAKKNKTNNYIEDLSCEEELEWDGFCDSIQGEKVASFNFTEASTVDEPLAQPAAKTSSPVTNDILPDNRKLKTKANDITPPIEGETFNTQRCYKIRNSTARMLNEIKAIHPDVNVYMNTIVDAALRHYHDYIFNKDGHKTL